MRAGKMPWHHFTLHQQIPAVGVWGESITLPNANIRWAPLCHLSCLYPNPQPLPLNPQPPGLTFSICSPSHCIPKSASTSMPQFPHVAPCMKGKPSSGLFKKSTRTEHFINGMKLVLISSIPCAPSMYPTPEKQQSAGQSLCPCGEYRQVKGRYRMWDVL